MLVPPVQWVISFEVVLKLSGEVVSGVILFLEDRLEMDPRLF